MVKTSNKKYCHYTPNIKQKYKNINIQKLNKNVPTFLREYWKNAYL